MRIALGSLIHRSDPTLSGVTMMEAFALHREEAVLTELPEFAAALTEAGADIVFPEALESEDEMRRACALIRRPLMANMADGGKTPIRSAAELKDIGYACAIFPATTALAAAAAVRTALTRLKETGTSLHADVPLYDFNAFCSLIGFEEVWAFERRWAE